MKTMTFSLLAWAMISAETVDLGRVLDLAAVAGQQDVAQRRSCRRLHPPASRPRSCLRRQRDIACRPCARLRTWSPNPFSFDCRLCRYPARTTKRAPSRAPERATPLGEEPAAVNARNAAFSSSSPLESAAAGAKREGDEPARPCPARPDRAGRLRQRRRAAIPAWPCATASASAGRMTVRPRRCPSDRRRLRRRLDRLAQLTAQAGAAHEEFLADWPCARHDRRGARRGGRQRGLGHGRGRAGELDSARSTDDACAGRSRPAVSSTRSNGNAESTGSTRRAASRTTGRGRGRGGRSNSAARATDKDRRAGRTGPRAPTRDASVRRKRR